MDQRAAGEGRHRAVRTAAIASRELDVPRTGRGRAAVVRSETVTGEICINPFYVCLERFDGIERRVIVFPNAGSEAEALQLASQDAHAAAGAYQEAGLPSR